MERWCATAREVAGTSSRTGKGTFLVPKGIEAGHHTVQIVQVANPGNQTILALGVTSKSNPEVTPTTTTTVAPTNKIGRAHV